VAKDITQNLILKTSLQDGISKQVSKAAVNSQAATDKINRGLGKTQAKFKATGLTVSNFASKLRGLRSAIPGLAGIAAIIGGGLGFVVATRNASEFSQAMSEVSTLVDTAAVDMDLLREGVLDVSNAFGTKATSVAKGLYQTISSGAVDAADSIGFLKQAQALATAGVASTEQAVDALTTTLNAYGLEASEAGRISDVLFETVRQGKTTLPELAQNLGRAIPLAAAMGISIEELTAAVAALTKAGIATDQAVVSLRGAFSALISPTTEADAILRAYNIDISKSRIEQDGFAGVLAEVAEKLGDNQRAIAGVFPNVRALTGVFALVGNQFQTFQDILEANRGSLGATGVALEKQLADPAYQAIIAMENLKNAMMAFGDEVIIAFNKMIERGGGAARVADQVALGGKTLGAVFGVAATSIGEAFDMLADFTDAMGGADKVAGLLAESIRLFGEMSILQFRKIADTVTEVVGSIMRDFFDMSQFIEDLLPGDQFQAIMNSSLGLERRIELLTDAYADAVKEQEKFASFAGASVDDGSGIFAGEDNPFENQTENTKRYAEATQKVLDLQGQLIAFRGLAAISPGASGRSEDTARMDDLIAQMGVVREKWDALKSGLGEGIISVRDVRRMVATLEPKDF